MAILLFFACLLAIYYASLIRLNKSKGIYTGIREAFIYTTLIYSTFVFLQVQILSAFNVLNYAGVVLSHALLLISTVWVIRKFQRESNSGFQKIKLTRKEIVLLTVVSLFIFLPLLFLCIGVPPNNSDAATCYLIRVEYWIKNNNILPYPTQNLFETYYNRFPQFFLVNARLLSGGDYFTGLFQYISYLGSILTVTLITKELGGRQKIVQLISACICLSIPQAILQSTAAMYDLQSAYAASLAVLFLIRLLKNPERNFFINAFLFSLAFSFTSYIKYSAVFFLIFFSVAACVFLMRKKMSYLVKFVVMVSGIFLFIHFTFFYQNMHSFNSIISPENKNGKADHLINERVDPGSVLSSVVKNVAVNLVTPVPLLNEKLYQAILKIHTVIQTKINDPQINLNAYYEKYSSAISESTTGNPNTTFLFAIAIIILIIDFFKRRRSNRFIYLYLFCLFLGFVFFCSIFKFQSWNARLQLPFFVLLVPAISAIIFRLVSKYKFALIALFIFCVVTALPYVYLNYGKPIISYKGIRQILNKPPSIINAAEYEGKNASSCLLNYYHPEKSSSFLHLNDNLSSQSKKDVFSCLESIDYFKNEKSVFEKTRNQMYLVPGYENSAMFLSNCESVCQYLFSNVKDDTLNVALVFGHAPEYPLIAMMRDYPSSGKINWSHIQYYSLPGENENFSRAFFYQTIVTNDSTLVKRVHVPVKKLLRIGLLDIIELEKSDSAMYRLNILDDEIKEEFIQ